MKINLNGPVLAIENQNVKGEILFNDKGEPIGCMINEAGERRFHLSGYEVEALPEGWEESIPLTANPLKRKVDHVLRYIASMWGNV